MAAMESAVKAVKGIPVQDAVLVVLCALMIYILRAKPSVSVIPQWHSHLDRYCFFDTFLSIIHAYTHANIDTYATQTYACVRLLRYT